MSDFEPIEIQIETSSNKAEKGLDNIDKALSNIQDSLKGITDALSGLSSKGASISKAMNRLAGDIEKINPDVFKKLGNSASQAADDTEKAAKKIESNIQGMVRDLKTKFNITNKDGIGKLHQALKDLYEAQEKMNFADKMGDGRMYDEMSNSADIARKKIEDIVREFGRMKKEGEDSYKRLADYVKGLFSDKENRVYLEPEIKQEYINGLAEKMAKTLGEGFTFNIDSDKISIVFDSIMEDIRGKFKEINWTGNIVSDFKLLVDSVKEGKIEWLSLNDAIQKSAYNVENLKAEIDGVDERIKVMAQNEVGRFMQSTMGSYEEDMREMSQETDQFANNLNKIGESASNFQQIVPAIEAATDGVVSFSQWVDDCFRQDTAVQHFANEISQLPAIIQQGISNVPGIITDGFQNVPMVIEKAFLDTLEEVERLTGDVVDVVKDVNIDWSKYAPVDVQSKVEDLGDTINRVQEEINRGFHVETWEDVFKDIDRINNSMGALAGKIGEANAEMSTLIDVRNRLNKAFSATESGSMPWDNERMQQAYAMLDEVNNKINKVKANLKDPNKLEIEVDPTGELEKLYARLKEIQALISDMRNNKINFSNEDMIGALKEQERIQNRIKEIEGRGSAPSDKGSLEWMAQIIAIQHELEKASAVFSKFGDIAKNAFLKAITPLKLFKHEFEEIKGLVTMVSRIGSAFAMISKPITKVFDNMRKKAEQSFEKIRKAWAKVVRTFTFMLLRKAITHIISTINDAITSLAAFSKSIGTDFNTSMSYLTSDLRYIAAALTAAFAPILNAVIPTFDSLADAIVGVINKVNMFLAVLTHAKSYTIAKKKIVDYTEAMEDANKKAKQLTMGIDELNILNEDQSSSKDKEDMFDWIEIPTPQIDIPDWLKWLKDLLKKLWDGIKGMLAALWDAIKKAWVNVRDFFINAIKHLIESIVGFILDIIRDLTKLFKTPEFQEFLERVMRIIAKIAELIATIIDRIRVAWNTNEVGYRILQDILAILNTIATHIENMLDMTIEWARELDFYPLFEAIESALQQVNYAVDQIGYVAEDVWSVVLGILKLFIEDYAPRLIGVIGNIVEGIGNIAKRIHEDWQELNFTEILVNGFDGLMQAIIPHLEAVGEYFKEWANGLDFKPFMKAVDRLLKALKPVADFIGGVFEDVVKLYILPMAQHIIQEVIPRIADAISHFANAVDWGQLRSGLAKVIEAFEHMQGSIGEGVADAIDRIGQAVAKFVNSDEFQKFLENLANFMNRISPELVSNVLTGIGLAILRIAKAVVKFVNSEPFQRFLNALLNFLTYSDANKIASILLNIAKAIVAFKFASFVSKGFANFLSFVAIIGKISEAKALKDIAKSVKNIGTEAEVAGTATQGLMSKLGGIGSAIGGVIKTIGGIGMAIGGSILAIKEFVDMWTGGWDIIKTILEALGIGIAAVGAVILGAPAAVAAVVAGIVFAVSQLAILLHQHWDEISKWFGEAWGNFKTWAVDTWNNIVENIVWTLWTFLHQVQYVWVNIEKWFASVWETFKTWAIGVWNGIVENVAGAWNTFLEKIQGVWATVSGWFSDTWNSFREWVAGIWQAIVQTIIDAWNGITEFLQGIWNTIWGAVQSIFGGIRDFLIGVWDSVSNTIQNVWNFILDFLSGLWNRLVELAQTVFGGIRDFLLSVWNTVQGVWETIWNTITNVIMGIWNFIKEQAEIIWNGVLEFFSNLWNGLQAVWETVWGTIRDVVIGIWNFISDTAHAVFEAVANFLSSIWDSIVEAWTTIWNTIHDVVSGIWNKIKEVATTIFGAIKEFFEKLWQGVIDLVKKLAEKLGEALTKAKDWAIEFVKTGVKAAADFVKAIWDGLVGLAGKIWEIGKMIVEGLWEGIKGAFGWLQDKLDNSFVGDIIKTIRELFGIHSPSKVMADEVGAYLPQGIGEGIEKEFPALISQMKDQISSMTDMLHSAMDVVSKQMVEMTAKTEQALVSLMSKISAFAATFQNLMVSLTSAASEVGRRISDGILSGLSGLSSKIGGLLNGISGSLSFNVPAFATGGFPEDGLFYANHSELIGSFNGRTAVANNNQITDGIAQAVSQSLVPILNDIADSNRVVANKDFSVDIDSREIARANSSGQSKLGKSLISFT